MAQKYDDLERKHLQQITDNYLKHLEVYRNVSSEIVKTDLALILFITVPLHREFAGLQQIYKDTPHLDESLISESVRKLFAKAKEFYGSLSAQKLKKDKERWGDLLQDENIERATMKLQREFHQNIVPNPQALENESHSLEKLLKTILDSKKTNKKQYVYTQLYVYIYRFLLYLFTSFY